MKSLLRSLIALSASVVLWPGAPSAALASPNDAHEASTAMTLDGVGFLDLKTFLIGPAAGEDPALASERIRVISPETLLYDRARTGLHDPFTGYGDVVSTVTSKAEGNPDRGLDEMTIEVNGTPVTLSLGLRDAMIRDLKESIRLHGVSGLFGPAPGIMSTGFLGRAADDIARKLDALESLARGTEPGRDMMVGPDTGGSLAAQSSLPVFAVGLLAIAWVRRSRLFPPAREAL